MKNLAHTPSVLGIETIWLAVGIAALPSVPRFGVGLRASLSTLLGLRLRADACSLTSCCTWLLRNARYSFLIAAAVRLTFLAKHHIFKRANAPL